MPSPSAAEGLIQLIQLLLFWLTGYSSGRHCSPGSQASSKDTLKPGWLRASPSYRITSERNSLPSGALFADIALGMTLFVSYRGKAGQGNMKNCVSPCQNSLWKNPPQQQHTWFIIYQVFEIRNHLNSESIEQLSGNTVSTGFAIWEETGNHLIPSQFWAHCGNLVLSDPWLTSAMDWIKNTRPS